MSEAFIGEIKTLGFTFAPRGYSLCAGQLLSISQNAALFSLLGTYYGGNGQTTFQLPDLQGRVAIGQGQGAGLQPYQIGQKAGTESTQLNISNLPAHNHQAVYTAPTFTAPTYTAPTAATTINAFTAPTARQVSPANALLTGAQDSGGAPVNTYATAGTPATLATGAASTVLTGGGISGGGLSGGGVTIGVTGSSIPFATLQPYLTITYAIATVGIFPTRS